MTRADLAAKRDLLSVVLDTLVPPSVEFPESGALALVHLRGIDDGCGFIRVRFDVVFRGSGFQGAHICKMLSAKIYSA